MIDLDAIFGNGPAVASAVMVAEAAPVPDVADTAADPLAGSPYADWAPRPDSLGRMGWEAPDLPEWQRWWARGDFDDFPPVPEGFRFGDMPEPAPPLPGRCVAAHRVDTLDVPGSRPLQGQLAGLGGA